MANVILLQKGDLKGSDFTNDNSDNKEGIGIRLSSDGGNLLQQRKNGLYYGVEAPPDTANLYVSSSMGDDKNTGTRAAPLKTIREAILRNSVGTTFTIHLFENDTHPVHGSWGSISNGKAFNLYPYGPIADDALSRNPIGTSQVWFSQEVRRPTIRFIYDGELNISNRLYARMNLAQTVSPLNASMRFYAVRFDMTAEAPLPTYNIFHVTPFGWDVHGVNITFTGCDFITKDGRALVAVGDTVSLHFKGSVIDSSKGGKLVVLGILGNLNVVVEDVGIAAGSPTMTPPDGKTPLTLRATSPTTAYKGMIGTGTNSVPVSAATVTNANIKTSFNGFF